jgi:hypothetical protein
MFAAETFPIWLGGTGEDWGCCNVEGGDVQPIGNGTTTTPSEPTTALPGRPPVVDLATWQTARGEPRPGRLHKTDRSQGRQALWVVSPLTTFDRLAIATPPSWVATTA